VEFSFSRFVNSKKASKTKTRLALIFVLQKEKKYKNNNLIEGR
jgi:hypothetical protein